MIHETKVVLTAQCAETRTFLRPPAHPPGDAGQELHGVVLCDENPPAEHPASSLFFESCRILLPGRYRGASRWVWPFLKIQAGNFKMNLSRSQLRSPGMKFHSLHEMSPRSKKNKNQGRDKCFEFQCAKDLPVDGTANEIMLQYVQGSSLQMKKIRCEETTMAQMITITVVVVFIW